MSSSERIFVIGGTGNIGTKCVSDLLSKQLPVTLYTRDPSKVQTLFPSAHADLIQTVQGDFNDITSLKEHLKGHTRLFMLIGDNVLNLQNARKGIELRITIAKLAYRAGVQQVVSLSASMVNMGYRTSYLGTSEYYIDKTIFELESRGHFVTLRPSRFMSNTLRQAHPIQEQQTYFDNAEADRKRGWISTNDIGAVAAVVLSEDPAKHGDAVYNLTGQVLSNQDVVDTFSKVLGREIKYQQVSHRQLYNMLVQNMPHLAAVEFCDNIETDDTARVNPAIEILLDRHPETLEEYVLSQRTKYFK